MTDTFESILRSRIKDRMKELEQDWKDEPGKNRNHMASLINGEIDGCQWVLDEMQEIHAEHD